MMRRLQTCLLCAGLWLIPGLALAQQTPPPPPPDPQQAPPERADPDVRVDPLQPDFTLAALPTTLRMPVHKLAFRVTHRFTRPIDQGDFGDFLDDFFGFDSAARIGLELRYGLLPGTQIGVHRTSDRTIQILGQQSILSERHEKPIGLDVIATLEGEENLQEHFQTVLGAAVSRNVAHHLALYAEPLVAVNSNRSTTGDNDTFFVGLGGRLRVRPTTYLTAEISPRLAGFRPGTSLTSFALETRAGGHLFQINVSNGFGTTLAQIARGGINNDSWFIGFNISRKFF
jgi:Membrane bound beta barrel domain (DUF5777)